LVVELPAAAEADAKAVDGREPVARDSLVVFSLMVAVSHVF
jgi:hypothetical protein